MSMDLNQLFTVKEFPTVKISIPCCGNAENGVGSAAAKQLSSARGSSQTAKDERALADDEDRHEDDNQNYKNNNICLWIGSSQAASTDFDLTGQVMWPVSILLGHYLASQSTVMQTEKSCHSSNNGSIVVELGAGGTGVPGLVAAHTANVRQVILTDGNESIMPLLQVNIDRHSFHHGGDGDHQKWKTTVSCQELVWGDRKQLLQLKEQLLGPVDMVVAADVVQWPSVLEPLLWTVHALLFRPFSTTTTTTREADESFDTNSKLSHGTMGSGNNATTTTTCRGRFVLGLVTRASSTVETFFLLADQLGFQWRKIPRTDYLQNGEIPLSCREKGGPMDIYELKLKENGSHTDLPLLLQECDNDDDCDTTFGRSYEHTLSRPC